MLVLIYTKDGDRTIEVVTSVASGKRRFSALVKKDNLFTSFGFKRAIGDHAEIVEAHPSWDGYRVVSERYALGARDSRFRWHSVPFSDYLKIAETEGEFRAEGADRAHDVIAVNRWYTPGL